MRSALCGVFWMVLSGTGLAATPLPVGGPAPGSCDDACEYSSGDHCPIVRDASLAAFPYDADPLITLEGYAISCAGDWEGPGGCYSARIKKAVDELMAPSRVIGDLSERAARLPDEARVACAELEPNHAQRAVDEAAAWCVLGRDECIEGLREAHRALTKMPAWSACVQRMERYANANAGRVVCADGTRPAVLEPTRVRPDIGEKRPAINPVRDRPIEVVNVPRRNEPLLADMQPERPRTEIVADTPQPAPRDYVDRRKGQFDLTFAPFSGVLTMRDPATGVEHAPMMAAIGVGFDVVLTLSDDLVLELGLAGRAAFGSTALGEAVAISLDELKVETGTAFVFDVEPTLILLSEYLGVGLVVDLRWDTIGITNTSGLASTHSDGTGGGLRLVAGLGLLERELRLVGTLDWMFIGTEATAIRANIQGELGPFILSGAYRQYFRLGTSTEAYVVDDLSFTLGYRAVF